MIVSGITYVPGRNAYIDRDGTKYGIAVHNTSNTATAAAEASYATRRTDGVSAHFYADAREVIQSLDTDWRAGHAGSYEGNENAVAVEITGSNDKARAWWIANVAWDELGRVLAAVCRRYGTEPRRASVAEMMANPKVRAFYGHDDMRRAWGGTTHTDPGGNFPWDHLFTVVQNHLATPEEPDMQLADKVPGTDDPNRTVGDILADLANLRNWFVGPPQPGRIGAPLTGSPGALLMAMVSDWPQFTGRDLVDEVAIITGVLAGLDPVALAHHIAEHLSADQARQVADELARRLTG